MTASLTDDEIAACRIGGASDPNVREVKRGYGRLGRPSALRSSPLRTVKPALRARLGLDDPAEFLARYWEQRPLLGRRRPGTFRDLFSVEVFDHLLATRRLPWHRISLKDVTGAVPGTRSLPGSEGVPDLRATSMFMNGGEASWPPLRRLNALAETSFERPATCFAFVTPPGGQHLELHWDLYDLFILQISGTKRWRVYPPLIELPADNQECHEYAFEGRRPLIDTELEEGTVLYVPRGFPHQARTGTSHAMHVSLALGGVTWHHAVTETWRRALEAGRDATLRAALARSVNGGAGDPVGRRRDAEALLGRLDAAMRTDDHAATAQDEVFFPPSRPKLARPGYQAGNVFLYRAAAKRPTGRTRAGYRAVGLRYVTRASATGTTLVFEDHRIAVPRRAARELAFILAHPTFCPADRPAGVQVARLTRLADQLTEAGFLARTIRWEAR